jgi:hypothetical protein
MPDESLHAASAAATRAAPDESDYTSTVGRAAPDESDYTSTVGHAAAAPMINSRENI